MLHLAKLQKQELSGKPQLRLLARQEAEYTWLLIPEEVVVPITEALTLSEGLLFLVELSPKREILSMQSANTWVLEILQTYLSSGITPAFLQQEVDRAEQWRQSLTLQNQELARRSLELEARREQIQALEESLRRDQEELEARIQQLEERLRREEEMG